MRELERIERNLFKFLIDSINNSINLRRVKQVKIEERKRPFNARPQQHLMLVADFGTFKSTIINILKETFPDGVVISDSFTLPALLGTINKQKEYVGGILSRCGGRILAIDEWNSLNYYAQQALLSPLENQRVDRQLGFKVKTPVHIKDKDNDFTDIYIEEGIISGKVQFTCIAMSMYLPVKNRSVFALQSRFRVIPIDVSNDGMKKIIKGLVDFNFVDKDQIVESVIVKKRAWTEYIDSMYDIMEDRALFPSKGLKGYVNRSLHDGLRDTIGGMILEEPKSKYVIDDANLLMKYSSNVLKQLSYYTHSISTKDRFNALKKKYPSEDIEFYYKKLGISERHCYRLLEAYDKEELLKYSEEE